MTSSDDAFAEHTRVWRRRAAAAAAAPVHDSPGRRPDELERLAAQREAAQREAEAERAQRAERAREAVEARKVAYASLVGYRTQLADALGQARFDLERATDAYDLERAIAAAERVVAIERAEGALKRHEQRIEAANLGRTGPIVSAGYV